MKQQEAEMTAEEFTKADEIVSDEPTLLSDVEIEQVSGALACW
jgi:hypothetical protein